MKKLQLKTTLFTLLIAVSVGITQGQSGWQNVMSQNGDAFFTDITFVAGDDNTWTTGWVLDYYGDIYKTEDGGDTWTTLTQSYSQALSTVCFVNEDVGYLCTYNPASNNQQGMILKSTDGGETWTQQISDPGYWFSAIRFKDELNGVVTGTPNMWTNDGGETWNVATGGDSDQSYGYNDYAANNTYFSTEIWNGYIAKSDNNGQSWSIIETEAELLPNYIDFLDGSHGITGGANEMVLFTHDGGVSWDLANAGDGTGDVLCTGWFDADTVYAAGSDIYKSTNGGYNWTVDTVIGAGAHRGMFVTPTNVVYVLNDIFSVTNSVWRKIGTMPLEADFVADDESVCVGGSVQFTDLSYLNIAGWEWTFPGGTPETSTEQNPTVTYDNAGVYDVTLTVTNAFGDTETLDRINYISVLEIPAAADMPSGEENLCGNMYYQYSIPEVEFAQSYEWEISPSEAGELFVQDNEATLGVSADWEGPFDLKVRALNECGDGEWSEPLEGEVFASPESFNIEGGGAYCDGDDGVEVGLSGSESGIDYELYINDAASGQIVTGTGNAISFGLQTEVGTYTVMGSNTNCEQWMAGDVSIMVYDLPLPAITGLNMVCDFSEENYEVAQIDGSTYTWEVNGGSIAGGQGTNMITVMWDGVGSGSISVVEETSNGCYGLSEQFDVTIDDCTGINDFDHESSLSIHPNPASDFVIVKSGSKIKNISLRSFDGRVVVASEADNHELKINTSGFETGLYLLKITTERETTMKKIIIN